MSGYGDATLLRVQEDGVDYAVVERADEVVGISLELLRLVADESQERMHGDLAIDADDPDLIHFGTPGRGLGRLTYRILERDLRNEVAVARRVR